MTDHLLNWTLIGHTIGWVVGLVGILAIASGLDWLQWIITSMFGGLVVGAGVGLATLSDRRPTCERYAEDDELELWGETR